jgi:hypothetical protein
VEAVTGVEHSRAAINGNSAIRRVPALEKEVLTLGQLVVLHDGGDAPAIQAVFAVAVQAQSTSRRVGRGRVQMIQGIGARYAELLQDSGIRTLEHLRRLDPLKPPPGIPVVKLNEFKTKAEVVLSLDVDRAQAAPLLDRSLLELMQASADALARDSGQTLEFGRRLQNKLRVLQIALDESHLKTITLRDLLTVMAPS